jgi:hypothetical protein
MRPQRHLVLTVAGGLVFAIAYLASLFGLLDLPEGTDTDAAVQAAFTDDRAGVIVGLYLLVLAGLGFLVFLSGLRQSLRARDAEEWLADLSFAGGLLFVTMLFAAVASWGVLAFGTAFDELPEPIDATLGRTLTNLGFALLLVCGLAAAALSIAAASAAIVRGRLAPRWTGWIGLAVAPLLLLGPFYVPQILLPLWVGAAAIGSWRSGRADPTLTPT